MKVFLATLLLSTTVAAQTVKVDPSINARFENPDIEDLESSLEREDRAVYLARHAIVAALGLRPGDDIADVGAGTGFMTRLMARQIGPHGRAYAVEIHQRMVDHIVSKSRDENLTNVVGVLGNAHTTNLPSDAVDLVLVCYVYHHFERPFDSLASIEQALRPDGRLVVIDRERIRGVSLERTLEHFRAGKGTFTDEILDAGFELEKELPLVEDSYFLVFRKREQ